MSSRIAFLDLESQNEVQERLHDFFEFFAKATNREMEHVAISRDELNQPSFLDRMSDFKAPDTIFFAHPALHNLISRLKGNGCTIIYRASTCHFPIREAEESLSQAEANCWRMADWVYSSSDQLVDHFKDEHRWREHTYSIIAPAPSVSPESSKPRVDDAQNVRVGLSIAATFKRSKKLEHIIKLLHAQGHTIVVWGSEEHWPFSPKAYAPEFYSSSDESSYSDFISSLDHALVIRNQDVQAKMSWNQFAVDSITMGVPLIVSDGNGLLSSIIDEWDCGIRYTGRMDDQKLIALTQTGQSDKKRLAGLASINLNPLSEANTLKRRNAMNLINMAVQIHQR